MPVHEDAEYSVLVLSPTPDNGGGVANFLALMKRSLAPSIGITLMHVGSRASERGAAATLRRLVVDFAALARRAGSGRHDLVHLNPSLNARSLLRDGPALGLLRLMGVRNVVVFFRGWEPALAERIARAPLGRRLAAWLLAPPCRVVVLSRGFVDPLVRIGVDRDRIHVETTMFDGAEIGAALAGAAPTAERGQILFMSRFVRAKGPFELMEAFAALAPDHPGIELVMAGAGPEGEALERRARELGLGDRVRFPGYLTGRAKAECLARSRIFALPTAHAEGLPNALLEAMAAGCAVVTTPVGGISDVVADEVHGRIIHALSPECLEAALRSLLADPAACAAIGERNREEAWRRYEARLVSGRIEAIYRSVLGRPAAGQTAAAEPL
jgi:glycosyltransferase involved in cell wall biosynthesis